MEQCFSFFLLLLFPSTLPALRFRVEVKEGVEQIIIQSTTPHSSATAEAAVSSAAQAVKGRSLSLLFSSALNDGRTDGQRGRKKEKRSLLTLHREHRSRGQTVSPY